MNLELNDKVVVVTGASRGIGRAIALGMADEGARVVAVARDKAALDKLATEARARSHRDALAIGADLSQLAEVERVIAQAQRTCGRIDVLVNNAGAIRGGDFLATPDAQWLDDWSLKLMGYIRMARAVIPVMKTHGGGRIINVVGAASRNPTATYLAGGAANAALVNFTKGLADLGAEHGILVTAVSPAATRTERWDQLMEQQAKAAGKTVDEIRAAAHAPYKLGRIATPEDIADVVCFLASARASFITGITGICITVDGGATRGVYP
jgi:3-oxoacyl-[acyl-carrier protein] reductase